MHRSKVRLKKIIAQVIVTRPILREECRTDKIPFRNQVKVNLWQNHQLFVNVQKNLHVVSSCFLESVFWTPSNTNLSNVIRRCSRHHRCGKLGVKSCDTETKVTWWLAISALNLGLGHIKRQFWRFWDGKFINSRQLLRYGTKHT